MGQPDHGTSILCQAAPAAPSALKNHQQGQQLSKSGWDPFSQENLWIGSGALAAWDVPDAVTSAQCPRLLVPLAVAAARGLTAPLWPQHLHLWVAQGGGQGDTDLPGKGVWDRMTSTPTCTNARTYTYMHAQLHTYMHTHARSQQAHAHKDPCTRIHTCMGMYA